MIYGYIRVSSDKQTVENQRFEISRFCDSNGLTIDGWIEETISGTRNYDNGSWGSCCGTSKPGTPSSARSSPGWAAVSTW